MPYRGWRSEPVISKSYTIRIGFHDTDGLVAVESGTVSRRRQHCTGELEKKNKNTIKIFLHTTRTGDFWKSNAYLRVKHTVILNCD